MKMVERSKHVDTNVINIKKYTVLLTGAKILFCCLLKPEEFKK